ncbi:hypothetical protein CG740_38195 [Streptomyces sp. CB01201]|nr:hypothetical protein CG740_38195 [Streptomyces sp. CB01201]
MLTMLALAACGTQRGQDGARSSADAVGAQPVASEPSPDAEVAFMQMLERVGRPCVPDAPAEETGSDDPLPGEHPPTRPSELLPVGEKPPTANASPTATAEQPKLNGVEKCEGREHSTRITKALTDLKNPQAAQVRAALNRLGYINSRIHDLTEAAGTVRFYLDLRVMGGQLAVKGAAGGGTVSAQAFAYPEQGKFAPEKRN